MGWADLGRGWSLRMIRIKKLEEKGLGKEEGGGRERGWCQSSFDLTEERHPLPDWRDHSPPGPTPRAWGSVVGVDPGTLHF